MHRLLHVVCVTQCTTLIGTRSPRWRLHETAPPRRRRRGRQRAHTALFLAGIEKCMKFINKNAYIQTAIFGYHFCKAAKCAFFLILRNIARIMALSIVSGFVLLLGKLVITAGATFLCYVCLAYTPVSDELNYIWLPLVFTAIIAFYVAAMFNEVWGMAMSTILQCFCADEEIYKGDKDAMYAGADLKATVSNSNKGKFAKKSKVAAAPAEDEGDAVI